MHQPIGVFDSGYGGLTVLKEIRQRLPLYDFVYLGDNARAPYGTRSYETVYQYTRQCVRWFFANGCSLVILACNTASAKALRTIQQRELEQEYPGKRVLGVIRPTTEMVGNYSLTRHVGILATPGTVQSGSYPIEISKFFPDVKVFQEACPMWVPLIENNEHNSPGADYFISQCVERLLEKSPLIDTILLACTHYPLLMHKLQKLLPASVTLLPQGSIVAESLCNYLGRHPEIAANCSKNGSVRFYTTDSALTFNQQGSLFYGSEVSSAHVEL
ncbi:glutamate racemase [Segetibacter sp. 3557_3]|uniref:glutamate racemase n=1 Tax=Segetibacter sp. 3557_3 TaxID=2547429 RepID=UPI0010590DCF|nr:glutamate racemase [Segetibacter sp. 3557_3]TDH23090.1 glutamate racemase [Segetibacter sp. 3557_3]